MELNPVGTHLFFIFESKIPITVSMDAWIFIREMLKMRYFTHTGKTHGVVVGFVCNGVMTWHDIVAVKKSPEMFFHVELQVLSSVEVFNEDIGSYSFPTTAKWKIREVRSPETSICLLTYLEAIFGEMEPYVLFLEKLEVVSDADNGWVLHLSSAPEVVTINADGDTQSQGEAVQTPGDKKAKKQKTNPKAKPRPRERDLAGFIGIVACGVTLFFFAYY